MANHGRISSSVQPEVAVNVKPTNQDDKPPSCNSRWRLKVGYFMQLLQVELFFIFLVILYGGMVFVQLALSEEDAKLIETEMNQTDLVLGSALLVEICLKLYAFGTVYLRNCWNLFDAVVVIASFVLSIVATVGTQSLVLLRILRLRIILRMFRVLVVFERVKQRSKAVHHMRMKGSIEAPLEHVLRILAELSCHPGLHPRIKSDIAYCTEMIKSNRLYDTGAELLQDGTMDADTQQWLRGEVMKSNNNSTAAVKNENRLKAVQQNRRVLKRTPTEMKLMPLDSAHEGKLREVLVGLNTWRFDVFLADSATDGHALSHMGVFLFHQQGLHESLNIDMTVIRNFFMTIEGGYVATNPYHNAIHGADVMQTVNYFINQNVLEDFLTPLDRAACLLAAAVHDFKHDGYNNAFQIANQTSLAIRYNDVSVFENYHIAEAFGVMKAGDDFNVFANLSSEDVKYVRGMMIELVLGTDMSKHFEDVTLFKTKIVPNPGEALALQSLGDKRLLLKLVLHTCDVSNPAKERKTMLRWTDRVVCEFFRQGDKEAELGLPVSPFMDRNNCALMKQQLGFIDYIVGPLFELWGQVIPTVKDDCLAQLQENRAFWEEVGDSFTPSQISGVIEKITGKPEPPFMKQDITSSKIIEEE